jgi:hypothetical protein
VGTGDPHGSLPDCDCTITTIAATQIIAAPNNIAATIVAVFRDRLNRGSFFWEGAGGFMGQSGFLILYSSPLVMMQ